MIQAKGPAAELTEAQLLELYEHLLTGRILEERLFELYRTGHLGGALYPAIGQEAAMVGFAAALSEGDVFGGTHRDLVAQLVRGLTLEQALLNFFGKAASPTRGRDGDAHLGSPSKGILMVASPVPDAHPVAVGCALAFHQRGEPRVAMANSGEGATATGTWHEAVNMAAVLGLPVVFTIQNNQYAYSTPASGSFRLEYAAHRADAYGIPGVVVDGNDVLECYAAAREAVERARAGAGPSLIEAVTFRHHGHTGLDTASYVDPHVRDEWLAKDPLPRYEEYLGSRGMLDDGRRGRLRERITARIDTTLAWAQDQPDPDPSEVAEGLFASPRAAGSDEPDTDGPEGTIADALRSTLDSEMERDERVMVLGNDVGTLGGPFGITAGLLERYGPARVVDIPLGGAGLIGAATGAALTGLRPVAEVQAADLLLGGLDQLVNEAAKHHWKTGVPVPLVVRAPCGAGVRAGPYGSMSPEGLLAHQPGIRIAVPSTPAAAKGLLLGALRDPNPVVLIEHKKLYRSLRGPIPSGDRDIAPGRARVARSGADVTVVTWGAMTHTVLHAAEVLDAEGISIEVIDLQWIVPLDWHTVFESVHSTSRLVVVSEDVPFAGVASEVAARVSADLFWDLDGPIVRVGPPHTHIPFASSLEDAFLPQVEDVVEAVRTLDTT